MSFSILRSSVGFSKLLSTNKTLLSTSVLSTSSLLQKHTQVIARSFLTVNQNKKFRNFGLITHVSSWSKSSCRSCSVQSHKGDEELTAFLVDEIENEKKAHASKDLPNLEGFECVLEGAEVTLTKKWNNEIITIKSNVNNSVDAEAEVIDPNETNENQETEMTAKPEFTVEIKKGKKTLSFLCEYSHGVSENEPEGEGEPYNDVFQISDLCIFEGEHKESTYSVSGEIMDGYLYDLLMNYLEERGISNDFAEKLIVFFTKYEHKLYINMLQGMKSFIEK